MAENLGEAVLEVRTDTKGFTRGIDEAQQRAKGLDKQLEKTSQSMKKLGGSMTSAGKSLSMFVTAPVVGLMALTAHLADVQLQAERGLGAALQFAGNEDALEGLKSYASGLQEITTVGDETTLVMLQVATSMGLSVDNAKTASKEAIGLAAAFGISEKSAIRYTASLADGDTTMLNRYIPSLRAVEDETERVALAHKILDDAFGLAVEAAKTGLGPWKQIKNEMGDVGEQIGMVVIEGLAPLVEHVRSMIKWVAKLSDTQKRWIVGIAGAAAALGPLLIAMGVLISMTGNVIGLAGRIVGFFVAKTAVTVADTGATVANTAANKANVLSLGKMTKGLGKAGLAGAVGASTFALTTWAMEVTGATTGLDRLIQKVESAARLTGWLGKSTRELNAEWEKNNAELMAQIEAQGRLQPVLRGTISFVEELARQDAAAAEAAKLHAAAEEELVAAIASLGLVTEAGVTESMAKLMLVIDSGRIPIEQLVPLLTEMNAKWEELGLLTPEMTLSLQELLLELHEQGEILTPAQLAMLDYADAMRIAGEQAVIAAAKQEELTLAVEDFMVRTADAMDQYTQGLLDAQTATGEFVTALSTTGPPTADSGFFSGLTDFFSDLVGLGGEAGSNTATSLLSNLGSMMKSGLKGLEGTLRGLFTKALSMIPVVGPILAAFAGPLFDGLKAIGKKVFDWVKGLFGGPDAAELQAREIAHSMDQMMIGLLDAQQLAEAGGQLWAQQNIAIRDSFLAIGLSEEAAAAAAKRLSDAVRESPEAAQAVIDSLGPIFEQTKAAMEATGLSMTELRNKVTNTAKRMGISTAEALQHILDEVKNTATETADAVTDTTQTMVDQFTTASESMSDSLSTAADIMAEDFLAAAQETKESFVEIGNGANDLAERIADRFSDMQFTVGVGFNVDDLPGAGTSKSNAIPALAKGGIVTRPTVALIGEKETEAVVPLSRLGAGGGSLTINLEVDGDRMATKVIKLTPRLLRELGLD